MFAKIDSSKDSDGDECQCRNELFILCSCHFPWQTHVICRALIRLHIDHDGAGARGKVCWQENLLGKGFFTTRPTY